jgi:exosome complex protein LRP1
VPSELFQWQCFLIKYPQAGNDKYDLERAEKQAKERARAQLKATMLARKSVENPSSAVTSEAQINDSEDEDSEGGVKVATEVDSHLTEKKQSKKKSKGEHKRKEKKERKSSKDTLKDEKKERRQKKEEIRKARKTQ